MYEVVGNLHMHTPYSDGYGSHEDIARAALDAGLDFVFVTDHNVLIQGIDGYRYMGDRRLLLLTGEEIHDTARTPQHNHLLVYEARKELSQFAHDPQELLNAVGEAGGIAYLAHPFEDPAPLIGEADLGWVDWELDGFHGLEIWNLMSEFKARLKTRLHALNYAFRPERIGEGARLEALQRWDALLAAGKRVAAIGGADAHALPVSMGPIKRIIFPYRFLFSAVNTHLLIPQPLSGDLETDRRLLGDSLRIGRSFVGYDLPAPTRGFRFHASGHNHAAAMGEQIPLGLGVTLQARLPRRAEVRLIRHGEVLQRWDNAETILFQARQPGAYRLEASLEIRGKKCGWIYSNPIYVCPNVPPRLRSREEAG